MRRRGTRNRMKERDKDVRIRMKKKGVRIRMRRKGTEELEWKELERRRKRE